MSQQNHRRIQSFLFNKSLQNAALPACVCPWSKTLLSAGDQGSSSSLLPGTPSVLSHPPFYSGFPRLLGEGRIQHRDRQNTPGNCTGEGQGMFLQVISSYLLTSELMDPTVSQVGVNRHLVPAYSVPRNSMETGSAQGHSFCPLYQI